MQDKFVADEGDFGKYGLLRTLAGIEPEDEPRYRLGVVWYLRSEAKLRYLRRPEFHGYDEELFGVLLDIVDGQTRTVKEIEQREILGEDADFFSDPLPNGRSRDLWLDQALERMSDSKIVLLDPDNGLPRPEKEAKPERPQRYAYRDELRRFLGQGKTVVIYQSYWRDGKRDEEVHKWRNERLADLDLDERPRVVGSDRIFIVLPAPDHVEQIDRRLDGFVRRWGKHFKHQAL